MKGREEEKRCKPKTRVLLDFPHLDLPRMNAVKVFHILMICIAVLSSSECQLSPCIELLWKVKFYLGSQG